MTVCLRLDSVIVLQKPKSNRLVPLNGRSGVKTKSSVRNVQHDSAIIRLEVDVGEPIYLVRGFWRRSGLVIGAVIFAC